MDYLQKRHFKDSSAAAALENRGRAIPDVLSLSLLVPRVRAHHIHLAAAADHPALAADRLH
jgi:hypothetical protein